MAEITVNGSTDDVIPVDILELLACHLQCRFSGQISDLRLSARSEGVIIHGHAQTYYAKQLATKAVMDATGLPVVANEIVVS
jgi:hypothetical protein